MSQVDVLVPTVNRRAALAVTLAFQHHSDFRVVVSDQSDEGDTIRSGEVVAVSRLLRLGGHEVDLISHLPRRGMAEPRGEAGRRVSL